MNGRSQDGRLIFVAVGMQELYFKATKHNENNAIFIGGVNIT